MHPHEAFDIVELITENKNIMRKRHFTVAILLCAAGSLLFSSCIGRFALTDKVLTWNNQIGSKFVNELVFVAFWILPVYEITAIADLLVINSIEFWSGNNPVQAYTKVVHTDNGNYLVKCDGKGYDIVNTGNGDKVRLDFNAKTQTWSVVDGDKTVPFMTFTDNNHVKMITADGSFKDVELSEEGVTAYEFMTGVDANANILAAI